jgi:cell division protein FtsI (penicillin-binding protein 3)
VKNPEKPRKRTRLPSRFTAPPVKARSNARGKEPAPRPDPRRGVYARVGLLMALLVMGGGRVLWRAYDIQVRDQSSYTRSYREEIEIDSKRGNIYDRSGKELAVSVDLDSFFADPVALRNNKVDTASAARALAGVLGLDEASVLAKLSSKKRFVWLKRRASPKESLAVASLGLVGKGVAARKEPRRYYPNVHTAAHVLGFTDDQGAGVEGLERSFETRLRGATDKVAAILDARGGVLFSEELVDGERAQGKNLTLTLDSAIQVVAERELELGVRASEARAGSVVVADPWTGEILALANYPTFNPNDPGGADPAARRNRAVTDRFEPGSVLKTFTVAGALAAGVVGPNQRIDCEDGALKVAEYTIRDTHRFGELTPAEILAYSSNIGTAKIGAALGRAGLFRVLRRFGFGARSEVELPAEAEGILRHYKRWYEMDAATISFGQGMSSTTLQLAMSMAAIANGGRLMKPLLVSRVTDVDGSLIEEYAPTVRRQVVPSHVARLVGDMLTSVTARGGTGEAAALDGYLVAGKTGTAQKADYAHGGYAAGKWIADFVGFVPAQQPRLVIAVAIDEPIIDHYGGVVAGPVFRRIALEALRHLGVPPAHGGGRLADIVKEKREQQAALAVVHGEVLEREREHEDEHADEHEGVGGAEKAVADGKLRVPDLKGLGARAAIVALQKAGFVPSLSGSGTVVEQSPEAGTEVTPGAAITLILRRPAAEPDNKLDKAPALASIATTEVVVP